MKGWLSWESLIFIGVVLTIVLVVLAGCSSMYVSTTIADTEYNWQWSFDKTEVLD
tara:strand:+ start:518 stop:682 length:165 start_codon:yes stop_codon:yes gene_type:complete